MRRLALALVGLALALVAAPASPRAAVAGETPLRITFIGPGNDAFADDVAAGIALAVAQSNDAKAAGAKRPSFEATTAHAGDSSIAALALEEAARVKSVGVIAFATESVAAVLETNARRLKVPLVLVGPGGPARTLDPADPVFRVAPTAAEYGFHVAELLHLKSGRASVGLPAETRHAVVLWEVGGPWDDVVEAARCDDVAGSLSKSGAGPSRGGVDAAREQKADRLVVLGSAPVVRGVVSAIDAAAWNVPIVALDTALDAQAWRCKAAFVAAVPAWADERHVDEVVAKHPAKSAILTPATMRGFVAAAALVDAAVAGNKRGVVAALRELHEGSGATEWPLFDGTGCVDRWRWSTWGTADGVAAPIKAAWLPDAALGPYLGGTAWKRYFPNFDAKLPGPIGAGMLGDTVVRVGFSGRDLPATVDADLATIGLAKTAGPAYDLVLDQVLARTCGKLSRVWSRNYDGSRRPALSFKIFFVPEGANAASPNWEAVIAGDGPDGLHGGQNFPKIHRAQALSTFLIRNAALLQKAKLTPPLAATDVQYLDGSYAWNTSADGNARSDKIRALIDGVASTYCMKLSKEVGHLAGLDVDHSGDPRSIMVAKGGEGTSDEFGYFPPAYAKILEKTLGRVGGDGK